MTNKRLPIIFGEVLFDCFPGNENVLGGAPFNVAWHLQALGDSPYFISRIGNDALGNSIKGAMSDWGLRTGGLQTDLRYSTGRVEVKFIGQEPHYSIMSNSAYDYIEAEALPDNITPAMIYHGTLALRSLASKQSFNKLLETYRAPVFLDVNLRQTWWDKSEVLQWLSRATWAKLNKDELSILHGQGDLKATMMACKQRHELDLVLVTLGEEGAIALTNTDEFVSVVPEPQMKFVDTVGAGDAFTAVLMHGLLNDWSLVFAMETAQKFASAIVGQRGATPQDKKFYAFIE